MTAVKKKLLFTLKLPPQKYKQWQRQHQVSSVARGSGVVRLVKIIISVPPEEAQLCHFHLTTIFNLTQVVANAALQEAWVFLIRFNLWTPLTYTSHLSHLATQR